MIRKQLIFLLAIFLTSCSGYFLNNNSPVPQTEKLSLAMADGSGYLSSDNFNEITPFVFHDKAGGRTYLFYSSDKDGTYDIYYAEMNSEGKFFAPVKMGNDINSISNDISPSLIQVGGINYIVLIREYSGNSTISCYQLDTSFHVVSSVGVQAPSNPKHASVYQTVGGIYNLLITDGSSNLYRDNFSNAVFQWLSDPSTNISSSLNSVSGIETISGAFTNIYALYDTMTGGRHQLSGEAFIKTTGTNIIPFNISTYSSSANDAYPFIDKDGGYKVYFASDRYGKGNYDLYRYNTATFDAHIPAYLKNFNAVYVSPAGNDANAGIIPSSPLQSLINAISLADIWGIHNIFITAGVYTPNTGLNTMSFTSKSNMNLIGGYNNNFTAITGKTELDMQGSNNIIFNMNSSQNLSINNFILRNVSQSSCIQMIGCNNITFINDIITNNITAPGGTGAGFYISSSYLIRIIGCNISYNNSSFGGGVYLAFSYDINILNCLLFNNYGSGGGGICAENGSNNNIINCTIVSNVSLNGGGIYLSFENFDIISSSTIEYNIASNSGGGIYDYNMGTSYNTYNCVIANNQPDNFTNGYAP